MSRDEEESTLDTILDGIQISEDIDICIECVRLMFKGVHSIYIAEGSGARLQIGNVGGEAWKNDSKTRFAG